MTDNKMLDDAAYNPDLLLDAILDMQSLKNDAALCKVLDVAPSVISKIRHRRLPVGASLLIRMHEVTNMTISELRNLMGDRRTKYRISSSHFLPKVGASPAQAIYHVMASGRRP